MPNKQRDSTGDEMNYKKDALAKAVVFMLTLLRNGLNLHEEKV